MAQYVFSYLRIRARSSGGWRRFPTRTYCSASSNQVIEDKDADTFGVLDLDPEEKGNFREFDFTPDDNDPADHHDAMIADVHRPNAEQYLRKMNYLVHDQKDLGGALQVLRKEMKEMCVKPEQPHFRLLIHSYALVGHLEKAFDLYREFRDRDLKRHVGILSDLFLSCTNSKDKLLALKKAHFLRKKIAEEHFIPTQVLYQSMIQAFGRCGDLEVAYELIDEMRTNQVPVSSETFTFLLQGCISDKQHGFRHALITWRVMRRKKVWANIHLYNLMLRAAQDCKIGDIHYSQDIIEACLPIEQPGKKKNLKAVQESEFPKEREANWWELELVEDEEKTKLGLTTNVCNLPNLLEKRPQVGHLVSLAPEDTPSNRLMLMGGHKGLIKLMLKDRVEPDLKTISQLLRLAPNTTEVECEIMSLMDQLELVPDVAFYNQLIRRRSGRGDHVVARSTLEDMFKTDLSPDILTFGNLAISCKEWSSIVELLDCLEAMGGQMNLEIWTPLVGNMAAALDPRAVHRLLQIGVKQKIKPDKRLITVVEKFFQRFRSHLLEKENGGYVPYPVVKEMRKDCENWQSFVNYYKKWLTIVDTDFREDLLVQYEVPYIKEKVNNT